MAAHHHPHLLLTRQAAGITGRKGILEVMGMNGAGAGLADNLRHLEGTAHIKSTAQSQGQHPHAGSLIPPDDSLDRLAEDGDLDTVCQLALTQVVDVLFSAAPLLVRYDMEYLHVAKVQKKPQITQIFTEIINNLRFYA
jgi:hypothetical protein